MDKEDPGSSTLSDDAPDTGAAEPLIAVQTVQAASTAKAAKVKNGLKKEGGQYYYYVKGKKVKNTWKTVTVANKTTGKKMTYRYYFSNTGKAYKGGTFFGENYLLVKKIGGKYYGFNRYAQMVKGVYYSAYGQSRAGFYAFNTKTGVYDAITSSRLRKSICKRKEFCSTAESPWQTSSYQKDRWLLW